MYLLADIPAFRCFVRKEYLYNLEAHHGETVQAYAFGVSAIKGRALGFYVMLETGAQFARLPISALCSRPDAPPQALEHLSAWDSLSYNLAVHQFDFLGGLRCDVRLLDKRLYPGTYLFTVDWAESDMAESPVEHKNHHVIALDNGNYAAAPNNFIRWHAPFFVTPFDTPPDYRRNTHVFSSEARHPAGGTSGRMTD